MNHRMGKPPTLSGIISLLTPIYTQLLRNSGSAVILRKTFFVSRCGVCSFGRFAATKLVLVNVIQVNIGV